MIHPHLLRCHWSLWYHIIVIDVVVVDLLRWHGLYHHVVIIVVVVHVVVVVVHVVVLIVTIAVVAVTTIAVVSCLRLRLSKE